MKHSHFIQGLLFVVSAIALGTACTDEAADQPVGTFEASARSTAELGVATWDVWPDGADFRIVGRDPAAARQLEMVVRFDADAPNERARIETTFPERGVLHLTRAGVIEDASSEYLQRVGTAVHADLGQGTVSAGPGDGFGTTTSALTLDGQGVEHLGWNLWGYAVVKHVNGWCKDGKTRSYATVYSDYGAYCYVIGWATDIPTDCTARLYLEVSSGHA
jgi:hypothetical protein